MSADFDVIVIGSGIGGMACAAYLAKLAGLRVLVLERHFKAGGQTHEFKRQGYEWDIGLHYVPLMGKGQPGRRLMDFVTDGAVDWNPLPDPYDSFVYPKFRIDVPWGEERYRERLCSRFPGEAEAIGRYFEDLRRAGHWFHSAISRKVMPEWMAFLIGVWADRDEELALQTTKGYLDGHFEDPLLRAVLASQWGDYGLSPAESAFGLHAVATRSFFRGAYYPVGGGKAIAAGFLPVLEGHGGRCLVNREVEEILVEDGRAVGVAVNHRQGEHLEREEFRAPVVVSTAGAVPTYLDMLPDSVELPFREQIRGFRHGHSIVGLYLGLREDPTRLGVEGGNIWVYESIDHERNRAEAARLLEGAPTNLFVSFPSARDPAAKTHTAALISTVDYEAFAPWIESEWKHRPPDYEAVKARIQEGMLAFAERAVPGLRELVDYAEVSTPLTMEHFTGHPFGAFYAVPGIPERYRQDWLQIDTPVRGLFLAGTDAAGLGIYGAAMGGALAAGRVMGGAAIRDVMATLRYR